MIPYGHQEVLDADVATVAKVLRSDFLTQGPAVPHFERSVAARVGAQCAVATNSATSALHVACLALGLGPGELLWTVPNTFVASANCARYCGADVDFVDIDPNTWNMSVASLRLKLEHARVARRLPKIIIPVHFAGQPTEQQAIWELAQEFGFRVLEDASHAIGASRAGEPVGSCRWSDVTVFSFHPVKVITSGEGGMATCNDAKLAECMTMLRSHGITRDPARFTAAVAPAGADHTAATATTAPPWHYEQQMLGFNYGITDIPAALGASQLDRLEAYVSARNAMAKRYDEALAALPIQRPSIAARSRSAFHLYVIRYAGGRDGLTHRQAVEGLRRRGVGVGVHYTPVHLQPYYRARGFEEGQFPESERHGNEAISLPLYPSLKESEQEFVISQLRALLDS